MVETANLIKKVRKFNKERSWSRFHLAKNLILALAGEVGELAAFVQWKKEKELLNKKNKIELSHELADIYLYLLQICDHFKIDLNKAALEKLKINEIRYPVKKSRGNAKKYNVL